VHFVLCRLIKALVLGEWHNYECHISAIFSYPSGFYSSEHEAGLLITVPLRSVEQKSVRLIYLNISAVHYTSIHI
jgi:hypothetical protein